MPFFLFSEHLILLILVLALILLLWQEPQEEQAEPQKQEEKKTKKRKWRPKSPENCPACQEGVHLSVRPIKRQVEPWSKHKSNRGRKKTVKTQGHACYQTCGLILEFCEAKHPLSASQKANTRWSAMGNAGSIATSKTSSVNAARQASVQGGIPLSII